SVVNRLVSRDTFRLAALGWITPFCDARMMMGSASLSAAAAWALSPVANASSTLPKVVRRRERRDLLISVRPAMTRVAFLAELVFAMLVSDRSLKGREFAGEVSALINGSGGGSPPPVGAVYSHRGRASQSPAKSGLSGAFGPCAVVAGGHRGPVGRR